jgi:signal transduction histidine kinase
LPRAVSDLAHVPRIMLVEDERLVAYNLQQRLQRLGYEVSAVVASCDEALARAREAPPDLVLMDIHIEGELDGIETAARLQEVADAPVVFLTAYSEESTLERARATRPYGYLVKPISERELHATIQMVLERRKAEIALRESEARLKRAATEREAAWEVVRRLNIELERKVDERTAALRSTIAELEAFSYSVAHDLRAGVRAISGLASILLEDYAAAVDESGRGYLRRLRSASLTLGNMVDGLLELSRIARADFERREVDLSAMASELAREIRESDPARQAEFVIEPGVKASADPRLARIALENLLRNAWKFTGRHERARIEFGRAGGGATPVYFVSDDGAGFDMTHMHRLFGAFERLHAAGEFEGTGIGLATVRRVIERHEGRIWARAEPERGATFFFTLQRGPGEAA